MQTTLAANNVMKIAKPTRKTHQTLDKTFLKAEEYIMFDSPAANVSVLAVSIKEVKTSMNDLFIDILR